MARNQAPNSYGFDFLKSEHLDSSIKQASIPSSTVVTSTLPSLPDHAPQTSQHHKPDLEKQFDVLHFLQAHRSAGCLPPSVIYKAIGIDLQEADASVAKMLENNPKIRVEHVPDPENPSILIATYAYQAKYNQVRDRTSLLAQINRCRNGVPMRDLLDSYDGVEDHLQALITAGDIIAVVNTEDKDKILFPRGEVFLVELDGIITLTQEEMQKTDVMKRQLEASDAQGKVELSAMASSCVLETDVDPRKQVRRGEAIQIGGQWFRVSSAVHENAPLSKQPTRAMAPLSVVSLADLPKRNEQDGYIRPLDEKHISGDAPLSSAAKQNLLKSKTARERLHKLAHGRNVATQLLSSHAHASNPLNLAASLANAANPVRKRPKQGQHVYTQEDTAAAQNAASDPALSLYSHARRHGCTKDVREMYLATRKLVPDSIDKLKALMVEHKLLEVGEEMRRARLAKRANVDNDGKPKKRRYYERKNQRMTNTHLEGTEIGAVLRRATEKQKQGKAVGDGGM